MIISPTTIWTGSKSGANAIARPPAVAAQKLLWQTIGPALDAEQAKQGQRETEKPRDRGADTQRIAEKFRVAVGNRGRAAPDIGR